VGRQRLDAGNVEGAGELVARGLDIVPGHPGLEKLGSDVDRAILRADIAGWFAGQGSLSAARVRGLTQRYRELAPEDYGEREAVWAASAAGYLSTLRNDPEAHNRFLQDARSVLADDGPLAGLATILPALPEPDVDVTAAGPQTIPQQAPPRASEQRPTAAPQVVEVPVERQPAATIPAPISTPAIPQLASGDLLGRWCTEDLQIEFEQDRMVFTLNGGRANYPVSAYDVSGESILVNWSDRQLGPMIFEFGRFTDDREKMVQIRGRPADDETWRTYNRDFLRCG
jgi:hypothetical protein